MTHDFPTVEEVMNGSPWDLIDNPFTEGKTERWRADSMVTGMMGYFRNVYEAIRSDSTIAAARADAIAARDAEIRSQIVKLVTGLDSLTARVDSIEAENRAAKADAARKAKFDEEPLTLPPDIHAKQASAPPSKVAEDETHHPGGELHSLDPKEEPSEDPDLEVEDSEGDLPKELLEGVPQAPGTYPDPELPKPPVVLQPIAISLNEE